MAAKVEVRYHAPAEVVVPLLGLWHKGCIRMLQRVNGMAVIACAES